MKPPDPAESRSWARGWMAVAAGVLIGVPLALGLDWAYVLLAAAVGALAGGELGQLLRTPPALRSALAGGPIAAVLWLLFGAHEVLPPARFAAGLVGLGALGIVGIGLPVFIGRSPARRPGKAASGRAAGWLAAFPYVAGGAGSIAAVQLLAGTPATLLLLAATWGGDVGGFLHGRVRSGGRPLSRWSPAKTVGGAAASLALSLVLAYVALTAAGDPTPARRAFVVGGAANLLGQWGDLAASRIKRRAGARHSGSLLGPQGGLLDAVDGLLFAAPFVLAAALCGA